MQPKNIFESKKVVEFLQKRQIITQYKKAKQYILSGMPKTTQFKQREPKHTDIFYFRINKQFRAWGKFDNK